MEGPYRVINTLIPHDGGVIRSIALGPKEGELLTGCQSDTPSLRRWKVSEDYKSIEEIGAAIYHDHWVTAITTLKSDPHRAFYPQGAIITGCMDNYIRVLDPETHALLAKLSGHSKGVISFSWTHDGKLISGSWDGTAKVWDLSTGAVQASLGPHENGVHVLGLRSGLVVTTSTGEAVDGKPANFQIRFWDPVTGRVQGETLRDHEGSIRSIAPLPSIDGMLTTSNDGTVALRAADGAPLASLSHPLQEDGSPPFVLDACAIPSYSGSLSLVSCAEDGGVVVWRDAQQLQVIPHPATVWTVLGLPARRERDPHTAMDVEGDREADTQYFVSGGHDGVLRFFSSSPLNAEDPVSLSLCAQFLEENEEAKRRKTRGPSAEDLARAPRWEDRFRSPGRSELEVKVFNDAGRLVAAQWTTGAWVIVGEVTGTGDGAYLRGTWYDHVLPVEVETAQGLQNLKLGYNNGENPFIAAQRFINENMLDQGYLQKIADWIIARAGQSSTPTLGGSAPSNAASSPSSHAVSALPPPPMASPPTPQTSALMHRFSGVIRGYLVFDELPQPAKLIAKVRELSAAHYHLSEPQLLGVERVANILSESNRYHATELNESDLQTIALQMTRWANDAFIAFDLLRLVALHPQGSELLAKNKNSLLEQALQQSIAVATTSSADSPHATLLTATRFFANALRSESLRRALFSQPQRVKDSLLALLPHAVHRNKLVRGAVMTVLFNYIGCKTTFRQGALEDPQLLANILKMALRSAREEQENTVVPLRALQIVGSLVVYPEYAVEALKLVRGERDSLAAVVNTWTAKGNADVVKFAKEVQALL